MHVGGRKALLEESNHQQVEEQEVMYQPRFRYKVSSHFQTNAMPLLLTLVFDCGGGRPMICLSRRKIGC